ncbi:outer envelope pore protein 16-4, chloroplastic [Apium graveolens]|uniref:outer envelope pore protein 16-4, chloroplastic n=1 Tax=Apium graveolens TaxID=4045 RepID=UPI003D79B931
METEELTDDTPCSSIAVDSILRIGYAGFLWGLCSAPYSASKLGLAGVPRASFVAKTVGTCGLQCGLFAGIFSFSSCWMQRYRREKDWVNALFGGAIAGAAVGAGTRNWKQVAVLASVVSATLSAANGSKVL